MLQRRCIGRGILKGHMLKHHPINGFGGQPLPLLCMILKRNILPVCLALLAAHLNLIDRKAQMEHPVGKAGNDAEIENKIGHTEHTLAGQIRKVNIGDGLAHGAEQSGNAIKCYAGVGVPGIDFFNPAKGGGKRPNKIITHIVKLNILCRRAILAQLIKIIELRRRLRALIQVLPLLLRQRSLQTKLGAAGGNNQQNHPNIDLVDEYAGRNNTHHRNEKQIQRAYKI